MRDFFQHSCRFHHTRHRVVELTPRLGKLILEIYQKDRCTAVAAGCAASFGFVPFRIGSDPSNMVSSLLEMDFHINRLRSTY